MSGPGGEMGRFLGQGIERRAERWLRARGLKPVTRNFTCRGGELDLVMLDGDTVVFVEVRLRSDPRRGTAAESVTTRKQGRLLLAARHFLARHRRYDNAPCRFDVIAVDGSGENQTVTWIKDAFSA